MSTSVRSRLCALGACVVAVVLVAGCSSSKSSGSGAGSSSASSAATNSPSGTPILIGSSGSLTNPAFSEPELKAGLDAAVAGINAKGGVNGHPLKLDFCNSAYDPNKELSCARQLISDHVVSVVHPSIFADTSGAEFKLYKQAGITVFGGYGSNPFELTDDNSYPLSSGLIGWAYGEVKALKDAGVKKPAILIDTNPPSQFFGELLVGAFKALGYGDVPKVTGDDKADPTFATAAAKASANGTDGIVVGTGPVDFPVAVKALKASDYNGKLGAISATMEPPILKALGSNSEGFLVSSQLAFVTDTTNPGIQSFLTDMKSDNPDLIDDLSLAAWAAVQLFAKILETSKATDLNAAAFGEALTNLSTPVDINVIAPYKVKGVTSPVADYPRVLNATVQVGVVHNGAIVPNGKGFIDPFSG